MKNSALELQTKLSSVTSEKLQIENRLQQSQLSLTEVRESRGDQSGIDGLHSGAASHASTRGRRNFREDDT
jgi:hypothetical protein